MLDLTSRPQVPEYSYLRREYLTRSDIAHFIRRNARTIAASILLSLAAAALYLALAQPIFTAHTQILIDPKLPQPLRESPGEPTYTLDSPQVESQIAVLRSEGLALSVIKKLGLLDDSEYGFGQPVRSEAERRRAALKWFAGALDVRRAGISFAIDIFFAARDPEKAARIANATAEAYLQNLLDTRAAAAKVGSEWLEERVSQLRAQMNNAARRVQEFKASQDYRIIKKSDQPIGKEPPGAVEEPTTLDELEATAQTYRKIYESFYQAFTETVQRESYPVSNARIISEATIPDRKSHPKTMLILALGAFGGTLVGFGIALVRHSLDDSVRSPKQIREEIGLECLGQVPQLGTISGGPLWMRAKHAVRSLIQVPQPGISSEDPFWVRAKHAASRLIERPKAASDDYAYAFTAVSDNPFSPFSGGVKRLKTALNLASKAGTLRCIGITSASPGEGKTTIAVNLAIQFGVSGVRTLLIDADLHKASLSRHLASGAEQGILEAMNKGANVAHSIVAIESMGIDLLPVAVRTDHPDAETLLASEKMGSLLKDLSELYAVIIVDLPPLLVADLSPSAVSSMG